MVSEDLSMLLKLWKYDANNCYRKITGDDGREKIQVRVDNAAFQGILQMELDGRPDGRRPHGRDFALDFYKEELAISKARVSKEQGCTKFQLNREACAELFDESSRIYNRYVLLLQLQDYSRVVRDTEHNMELFRFVKKHARRAKDQNNLEKWWPYIIRINSTAKAMQAVKVTKEYSDALQEIRRARRMILNLEKIDVPEFQSEYDRSLETLDELELSMMTQTPVSELETLQIRLDQAVEEEKYEEAAELRDKINEMRQNTTH